MSFGVSGELLWIKCQTNVSRAFRSLLYSFMMQMAFVLLVFWVYLRAKAVQMKATQGLLIKLGYFYLYIFKIMQ